MADTTPPESIRALASSEIYIKSRRTRQRFMPILEANLEDALATRVPDAVMRRHGNQEFDITGPDLTAAAEAAATVFGFDRIDRIHTIPATSLRLLPAASWRSALAMATRARLRATTPSPAGATMAIVSPRRLAAASRRSALVLTTRVASRATERFSVGETTCGASRPHLLAASRP